MKIFDTVGSADAKVTVIDVRFRRDVHQSSHAAGELPRSWILSLVSVP
jgi:hypothetical protein